MAERRWQMVGCILLFALLAGCTALARPAPVLKVGLLAPFEGERRELGYQLLPAIRAATPERVRGQRVEWVILDTSGDPATAAQRARELLADPDLYAIVGPLLPAEVAAVAPLMAEAGMAWWPLAPNGEDGLAEWAGPLAQGLEPTQRWGASAWPAIRRGSTTRWLDPQLPTELGALAATTPAPWPQAWLAWGAAQQSFAALEGANELSRAAVRAAATPVALPPAVLVQSVGAAYPGQPVAP